MQSIRGKQSMIVLRRAAQRRDIDDGSRSRAQAVLAALLKASICAEIELRSLPSANGVTLQSGIEIIVTRSPPADVTAQFGYSECTRSVTANGIPA